MVLNTFIFALLSSPIIFKKQNILVHVKVSAFFMETPKVFKVFATEATRCNVVQREFN